MEVIGKKFIRNGTEYKVIAYDNGKHNMVVENMSAGYEGNISCLCDAFYEDDKVRCSTAYEYCITKNQCYDAIKESGATNVSEMSKAIHNKYYRIPNDVCMLIAESYCND